jgi:hypothetical protein
MLPEINVFNVNSQEIMLNWFVQDNNFVKFNLYGCSTFDGEYSIVEYNIPNKSHPFTPGNVLAKVSRTSISLLGSSGSSAPYFFKITGIDYEGIETDSEDSLATSVDSLDDVVNNRLTDNNSPVYKNFILTLGSLEEKELDISRLLGRNANYLRVSALGADASIRFNSVANDSTTIKSNTTFELPKQSLLISKIFITAGSISSPATSMTVEIFVTGN